MLGFDLGAGPSGVVLAFLDFFLPLVAGAGLLAESSSGIGAGSTGSGTGTCMSGVEGDGLGGGGVVEEEVLGREAVRQVLVVVFRGPQMERWLLLV